jgi:hypothetical protein
MKAEHHPLYIHCSSPSQSRSVRSFEGTVPDCIGAIANLLNIVNLGVYVLEVNVGTRILIILL